MINVLFTILVIILMSIIVSLYFDNINYEKKARKLKEKNKVYKSMRSK